MDIIEVLKQKAGMRISLFDKYMFWNGTKYCVVLDPYPHNSYSKYLLQTESEEKAVAELVKE